MRLSLGVIVEGHGEKDAVPLLVRRIVHELDPTVAVQVPHPIRVSRGKLLKEGELERAVDLAARIAGPDGAVLVILDSDDDCPATLGPQLLRRAQGARGDISTAVVLAKREFESWFLAAIESLRGHRGLPTDLVPPEQPEEIRGAKEWLGERMSSGKYVATLDQAAFAADFDMGAASRADSFSKCYREVRRLLEAVQQNSPAEF